VHHRERFFVGCRFALPFISFVALPSGIRHEDALEFYDALDLFGGQFWIFIFGRHGLVITTSSRHKFGLMASESWWGFSGMLTFLATGYNRLRMAMTTMATTTTAAMAMAR
jgi:hypothetical protein